MDSCPEPPSTRISTETHCRITFGNFEKDKWYFLTHWEDSEYICKIVSINEELRRIRVQTSHIRGLNDENAEWIPYDEVYVIDTENHESDTDTDSEDDEDPPMLFVCRS